jgi:hypothetical protein
LGIGGKDLPAIQPKPAVPLDVTAVGRRLLGEGLAVAIAP